MTKATGGGGGSASRDSARAGDLSRARTTSIYTRGRGSEHEAGPAHYWAVVGGPRPVSGGSPAPAISAPDHGSTCESRARGSNSDPRWREKGLTCCSRSRSRAHLVLSPLLPPLRPPLRPRVTLTTDSSSDEDDHRDGHRDGDRDGHRDGDRDGHRDGDRDDHRKAVLARLYYTKRQRVLTQLRFTMEPFKRRIAKAHWRTLS